MVCLPAEDLVTKAAAGTSHVGGGRRGLTPDVRLSPAQFLLQVLHVAVALCIVDGLGLHKLMQAAQMVHLHEWRSESMEILTVQLGSRPPGASLAGD